MKKKLMSVTIIVVMVMSLLIGCNGNKDKDASGGGGGKDAKADAGRSAVWKVSLQWEVRRILLRKDGTYLKKEIEKRLDNVDVQVFINGQIWEPAPTSVSGNAKWDYPVQ